MCRITLTSAGEGRLCVKFSKIIVPHKNSQSAEPAE